MSRRSMSEGQYRRLEIALLLVLGLCVVGGFALAEWRRTGGRPGAPLDDVYIHFQYARNLASGDGFGFNPNQPTSGSTSPLWVLLLSGAYALLGELAIPARALSATAYLGVGAVTTLLAYRLLADRRAALLGGMLTVLSGRLAWAGMSGMETTLFCLVSLLGILRHDAEQAQARPAVVSACLFGLASLLRPEGYLLFVLAVFARWLTRWRQGKPILEKRWLAHEASVLALYLAFVLPYPILSYAWTGHLLPNTFRVVSGDILYQPMRYARGSWSWSIGIIPC